MRKLALTPTLSHRMGERGTKARCFHDRTLYLSERHADFPSRIRWERRTKTRCLQIRPSCHLELRLDTPSPIRWERAGVRAELPLIKFGSLLQQFKRLQFAVIFLIIS